MEHVDHVEKTDYSLTSGEHANPAHVEHLDHVGFARLLDSYSVQAPVMSRRLPCPSDDVLGNLATSQDLEFSGCSPKSFLVKAMQDHGAHPRPHRQITRGPD